MRLKSNVLFVVLLAFSLVVTGCGKKNSTETDATTSPSKKAELESNIDTQGGGSSTTSEDGTEVKIEQETEPEKEKENELETKNEAEKDTENDTKKEPERVVASSVAVVQILNALSVPMVGVPTSSYELPESVAQATKIGNAMSPDLEVIASLNPSVIVSVDSLSEDLKTQFETLKIESQFVNLSSYEGLLDSITALGERFDAKEKAKELVDAYRSREEAIKISIEKKEAPSVLIIFGAGSSFMVASDNSYVGDLVKRVGAKNIIADAKTAFTPVDMEYLADKNPDYILFMAHANPKESLKAFETEFSSNAAWKNFDAVKNGKVIALETGYFGMSANLLAMDAMEKLVTILYTE